MKDQNRNLPEDQQQNQDSLENEQQDSGLTGTEDRIKNVGSESNAAPTHGHVDLHARPSEGHVGNTHSSGISTKRSVTGSDFDGQVTPS